ncbi:MAG TPA: molybdopterin-dependent oxidoreductase [Blastocatellia bacterium]|nr:molybdopterin-dependent oxidoreductase [Blastocatellia bacterium]
MSTEKLWQIIQQQESGSLDLPQTPGPGMSRRTFIEMIGFSVAALAFTGCRPPEQKIIPFVKQPVELTPGVANWYASTCLGCNSSCGTLVKVRDGRPIKLEGNPEHPLSRGGLCPVAHAMVFSLYDSDRLRQPLIGSATSTWDEVDRQIADRLAAIKQSRGKVRVVTPTITSPTSRAVIEKFVAQFADCKHVVYQAMSNSAIQIAHQRSHNLSAIPFYRLDKAKLAVSFGADFLGTWIAPVQFTRDYSAARSLQNGEREMLRHVQFESRMSLTGGNADRRVKVSPAEEIDALLLLASLIAEKASAADPASVAALASLDHGRVGRSVREAAEDTAAEMLKLRGESLVISGSNDPDIQQAVNFINHALGNYGKTLDLAAAYEQNKSDDARMVELVSEMNAGGVAALVLINVNPAYDYFGADDFVRGLAKTPLKISLNPALDETASHADFVCPQHHFLEAWNDAEPARGILSLCQPTIAPLFQTRQYQESLLKWTGDARAFYDVLREHWKEHFFPQQTRYATFDEYWDRTLHDGAVTTTAAPSSQPAFISTELGAPLERLKSRSAALSGGLSAVLYEKNTLHDGVHANNPWLHELPDPITKITWDNYACVGPKYAERFGIEEGRVVRITKGDASIEVPAHIQPGQHDDAVAIAVGYGRTKAGKAGTGVGVNAFPLVSFDNGSFQYVAGPVTIEKTARKVEFAKTQVHDVLEDKPIFHDITLARYLEEEKKQGGREVEHKSIWPGYEYNEHKWGVAVDLSACTGCSACVLSCQAENNVPVVGKDEVRRRRELHWIRLDRYYLGSLDEPKVAYQPVFCHQCDNASCESVCPVLATVHSSEGLNMQVYNRCVGTRYCENNCAYKVRRFNWFEYEHTDPIANLALNPDVTVRSRGVMEKCTFCVQRIEEAKIRARNEGRQVRDGEIQPACQQSCPAGAITFGNLIDPKSRVAKLKHDHRNYTLLDELNLRPALSYLAKVRNTEEA